MKIDHWHAAVHEITLYDIIAGIEPRLPAQSRPLVVVPPTFSAHQLSTFICT